MRVLLVDDSRTVRLLVKAYLVGRGYEFVEKEDGRQALGEIRRLQPDLVICDVFMPGMGGWDFVRALRSDPRREVRTIPVILASSKRDEDVARQSQLAGANAFLSKPIAGERLLEVIDALLARSAREDERAPESSVVSSERAPQSGSTGRSPNEGASALASRRSSG